MTKLEREIIEILSKDCRIGAEQLAAMLNVTREETENAIRSLEKRGVLVKYSAIVNLDEEEDECVEALIEVKVTPQSGSGFDGIADEIARHSEVKSLYLMSGAYDFAVIVESNSIRSVSRFISECISTFDCVLSTATHFILKKYKIEGAFTRQEKDRRISVQA
ncbi:MAG: Lrp/AsnC family transcriptional regulator [Clostridia bacterium]|nr:Lrp/AsnC family transcriptional regulator [Clostridia bacterium]